MTYLYGVLAALVAAAVLALAYLYAVSWIESRQARQLAGMRLYAASTASAPRTAVVYFSRSGNTALAARHVATSLAAALYPLQAADYQPGLPGLGRALNDANARRASPERLPDISPRTLDLTPFDTVWLGSPVWLYSPAPPIWAFVEHNRFDGKDVVLFNTFNSHIGADHLERLRQKVMARGAKSFTHRSVLRGRMTQQISPEAMLQAIDEQWLGRTPD